MFNMHYTDLLLPDIERCAMVGEIDAHCCIKQNDLANSLIVAPDGDEEVGGCSSDVAHIKAHPGMMMIPSQDYYRTYLETYPSISFFTARPSDDYSQHVIDSQTQQLAARSLPLGS